MRRAIFSDDEWPAFGRANAVRRTVCVHAWYRHRVLLDYFTVKRFETSVWKRLLWWLSVFRPRFSGANRKCKRWEEVLRRVTVRLQFTGLKALARWRQEVSFGAALFTNSRLWSVSSDSCLGVELAFLQPWVEQQTKRQPSVTVLKSKQRRSKRNSQWLEPYCAQAGVQTERASVNGRASSGCLAFRSSDSSAAVALIVSVLRHVYF